MQITQDIQYVGVNDHEVDLFEGQYVVPNGMAYNSYVIMDDKIAVMDTVDVHFKDEWLDNLERVLSGRKPDYLVVQHMEPDHAGNVQNFTEKYPDAVLVANDKTFAMMDRFFEISPEVKRQSVANGESLTLGKHVLTFVYAPMVHWPEVMMTYESTEKVLFSADGFGKFGANDVDEPWDDESRRYFIGIVGKYGAQTQAVLQAAAGLDIQIICPLHGPVLTEDLGHYLALYDKWSSYTPEEEGIVVAYTSVYGHTKEAVEELVEMLKKKGAPKVVVYDLARCDMAAALADAFRYSRLVLATTTYNAGIYPFMHDFLTRLAEHNFQKRKVALVENGSWAPTAAKQMREILSCCKNLDFMKTQVTINSAVKQDSREAMEKMTDELCQDYIAQSDALADRQNLTALFRLGYGLYVVTSRDGDKDNGMIVNTVTQLTDTPNRIAVNINKKNYTHDIIKKTGVLNVNCLSVEAPFSVFQNFGFRSGRDADKFSGIREMRTGNGLRYLPQYCNAVLSLKVEQYVDLDTHGMFICTIDEARVFSDKETMTYTYYQTHVKPKPQTGGKKGFVCVVCGYVYEGDVLPEGFVCPLCKHGATDFVPIG